MYTNADYDEYRHFMEQVGRNDNAKITNQNRNPMKLNQLTFCYLLQHFFRM
jgi:hypothetical protein